MHIITFLKKSIKGELSLEEQKKYLQTKTDITPQELAATVKFLQKQMSQKINLPDAIDICGTGGSGLPRINTSTIASILLARSGIKIAKHGNKAASGRFGSFDLIEKLGIDLSLTPKQIEKNFEKTNLAFLYARNFHPVMRHFAEARTAIGKPTFFNLLGPLLNPANTQKQVIGTTFKDKMQLLAETCKILGKKHIIIVSGSDGLDEVTLTGKTYVTELLNNKISNYEISPEDFGMKRAKFSEIKGGTPAFNTKICKQILEDKCKTRHKDLVLINCALALRLINQKPNILTKIVNDKEIPKISKPEIKNLQKSDRNFLKALKTGQTSVIAEIKKASPSKGLISKDFDPKKIAQNYEENGASAISVITDKKHFQGSFQNLKIARQNTTHTPLLCKDFIIHENQIFQARKHGADAILLIAALLSQSQITQFTKLAKTLNMDVLCEVHTIEELEKALKTPVKIIGINNRDLTTFKTDLNTTNKIAKHIPKHITIVSESGIHSKKDIQSLPKNINAVLVGTSLMQGTKISQLIPKKLKICGVRTAKTAKFCEEIGVDFIGLNFVPTSKRKITTKKAIRICKSTTNIYKVGIFQNQPIEEIDKLAPHLDFIQLSGEEPLSFVKKCQKPVIKTIKLHAKKDIAEAEKFFPHCAYILFDSTIPGSGKSANHKPLRNFKKPFLLAGGINPSNTKEALKHNPLGIDIASGAEIHKPYRKPQISHKKITQIFNQIKSC
ncbi:bifunctional indole-3-glycerol-phosphate synthase TrpC/phosphoribosylanthranilate isomerase TrpF [Candidatus Peregrinibacteria bacterium]|jgi:indole-3-glycerol phosphate synthase / phosphoribosylanthranilate isomerase|nr:bifunctional indole-3-glycerol-phosphate synthase TrpC/phosphoribosylanthranilate isomerase TrpF [Candidatus Peregrinibacteria bacterium]MBT4056074.1 bifunctional indole-3-glycerol-phosphate synthase TrpC/phosphoribosylanthranilate isomerase TrpF [Candidatus Peregrinibacteria bacterium]